MTIREKFEVLPPEVVTEFLQTRTSSGLSAPLQNFILAIDKVPEHHRRFPATYRCARELVKLYPHLFTSISYAREIIYAAVQYFHLNNSVSNAAWDNYYADKQDELSNMAIAAKQFDKASICLDRAHKLRTNKDDNAIDASKLCPHTFVVTPVAPASFFGFVNSEGKEPSLKEIFLKKETLYKRECVKLDALQGVSQSEIDRVKAELRANLNLPEDVDYEEIK